MAMNVPRPRVRDGPGVLDALPSPNICTSLGVGVQGGGTLGPKKGEPGVKLCPMAFYESNTFSITDGF
jgi:hypothetical protein